jgi:hypothetical protein
LHLRDRRGGKAHRTPLLTSISLSLSRTLTARRFSTKNDQWQLVNFGKYLSSLPVIWLSAIKSSYSDGGTAEDSEIETQLAMLWLYSVVINTVYSFLWDVFKDWGLGRPRSSVGKPQWLFLRPVLAYSLPLYYYVIIVVDLALRGCWSLKLSSHLQVGGHKPAARLCPSLAGGRRSRAGPSLSRKNSRAIIACLHVPPPFFRDIELTQWFACSP